MDEQVEAINEGSEQITDLQTPDLLTEQPEIVEEVVEEVQEEVDEEVSQPEKSRLGRRVKALDEKIDSLRTYLEQTITQRREPEPAPRYDTQYEPEELPEYVATADDVIKVMEVRERQVQQQQMAYANAYDSTIQKMADPEFHNEVVQELMKNNNVRYKPWTHNPAVDAEINYEKALAAVMRTKIKASKPNVLGSNSLPTGMGMASRPATKPVKTVKLDPISERFMVAAGLTREQAAEMLSEK
jgi:hypothetical protein